jgi:hypothetical protein
MVAFWFLGAVVAFLTIIWAFDVYRHRHPLNNPEVFALSRKRQRTRALAKFSFSTMRRPADVAEKKAMKAQGQFVSCDLGFRDAPAQMAGLLKYKKHEWIVIAFINSFHIRHLWWNKGPNRTNVWSLLRDQSLSTAIHSFKPDAIAILHNHPNPDPSRYRMNIPSELDLQHALFYDGEFSKHGISLLEFICERGVPYLYYASFAGSVALIDPIIDEIQKINGTGIFKNYSLRKELRRTTKGEQIAGGSGDQTIIPQL